MSAAPVIPCPECGARHSDQCTYSLCPRKTTRRNHFSAGTGRPRGLVVARNGDGANPIHECGALCSFERLVPGEGFSLAIGGVARRGSCYRVGISPELARGAQASRASGLFCAPSVLQDAARNVSKQFQKSVPPFRFQTWNEEHFLCRTSLAVFRRSLARNR